MNKKILNKQVKLKEAIILCGGLGTRLKSVVSDRPKPMADFNGQPFLLFLINFLSCSGIETIILSTGYMSMYVEKFFIDFQLPVDIKIIKEPQQLGTGGAVKYAANWITGESFFVLNGDSFCQVDLAELELFHVKKKSLITMLLTIVDDPSSFGTVLIDEKKRVIEFQEKKVSKQSNLINAGLYLFDSKIMDIFPEQLEFSLEYDVFPKLTKKQIWGYQVNSRLYDIGTPETYAKTIAELKVD